jgi:hypothetical protein
MPRRSAPDFFAPTWTLRLVSDEAFDSLRAIDDRNEKGWQIAKVVAWLKRCVAQSLQEMMWRMRAHTGRAAQKADRDEAGLIPFRM